MMRRLCYSMRFCRCAIAWSALMHTFQWAAADPSGTSATTMWLLMPSAYA